LPPVAGAPPVAEPPLLLALPPVGRAPPVPIWPPVAVVAAPPVAPDEESDSELHAIAEITIQPRVPRAPMFRMVKRGVWGLSGVSGKIHVTLLSPPAGDILGT
jgi:hypothetical protein